MMNTGDMRKRLIASGYEYKQRRVDEDRAAQEAAMHAGSSWRAKTEANKIVADRIGTADHPEIDVLNLPFSTDMPKVPEVMRPQSCAPLLFLPFPLSPPPVYLFIFLGSSHSI